MQKRLQGDHILSIAPFFQTVVLMLQEILINANIFSEENSRVFSITLSAIPVIPAVYIALKRNSILVIFSYLGAIIILVSTLVFFPDNKEYIVHGYFYLLIMNIPCFICLATLRDTRILEKVLLYFSYAIFLLGIVYLALLIVGTITFSKYSMSFSYYLLLPALVFLNQKNILYTFLFFISCILIFMIGSRGPLVSVLSYTFMLFLLDKTNRRNITFISFFTVILFGALSFLFSELLNITGVNSRTLALIIGGEIYQDSNRFDLYSEIWNSILVRPWLGYGVYGDRVVLDGTYTHNILLEVVHNYGLIIGSVVIIFSVYLIYLTYFKNNIEDKKLLILFFCYCILPLFFSGSYLNDPEFGIFSGFLISTLKK